jgi:hypothetical protein
MARRLYLDKESSRTSPKKTRVVPTLTELNAETLLGLNFGKCGIDATKLVALRTKGRQRLGRVNDANADNYGCLAGWHYSDSGDGHAYYRNAEPYSQSSICGNAIANIAANLGKHIAKGRCPPIVERNLGAPNCVSHGDTASLGRKHLAH